MTLLILAIAVALLLFLPRTRGWIVEEIKALSDFVVLGLLRLSSRFGSELTPEGKAEQALWREQRLRNLRGLALRAKEAVSRQPPAIGKKEEERKKQP